MQIFDNFSTFFAKKSKNPENQIVQNSPNFAPAQNFPILFKREQNSFSIFFAIFFVTKFSHGRTGKRPPRKFLKMTKPDKYRPKKSKKKTRKKVQTRNSLYGPPGVVRGRGVSSGMFGFIKVLVHLKSKKRGLFCDVDK